MALRIVFFSDSHLGFDEPVRSTKTAHRRGPDFFNNFQRVLDYATRTQADLVVHGGDFFFRSNVHHTIVDRAYQLLFEFAEGGIPIVIVPGNHERSVLPPSLFLNHPNIYLFDRPRTYMLDLASGLVSVSGFPYQLGVRQHFQHVLSACDIDSDPDVVRLMCFHHAVEGAKVGPSGFTFRNGVDVIAAADLPTQFDAILSGHIHRHQVLGFPTPVIYCGSIERTSFAEKTETKGFCELEIEQGGCTPQIRFHELPTRPMIDFDGSNYQQAQELLAAFATDSEGWPTNAIVRIHMWSYPEKKLMQELRNITPNLFRLTCSILR